MELFTIQEYSRIGANCASSTVSCRPDLGEFIDDAVRHLTHSAIGKSFLLRSYFSDELPPFFLSSDIPNESLEQWRLAFDEDDLQTPYGYNEAGTYLRTLASEFDFSGVADSDAHLRVLGEFSPDTLLRYAFLNAYFGIKFTLPSHPDRVTLGQFGDISRDERNDVMEKSAAFFDEFIGYASTIPRLHQFASMSLVGILHSYANEHELSTGDVVNTYRRLDRKMGTTGGIGVFIVSAFTQSFETPLPRVYAAPIEAIVDYAFKSARFGLVPNAAACNQYLKQTVNA